MQRKLKNVVLSVILCLVSNSYFGQKSMGQEIDSMTLTISYDNNKHVLRACFTNLSNSVVILPWQEQLPYIEFDTDTARFSILLGNNIGIAAIGLQDCIPSFTFESNNIELKPKETSCKVIELDWMISKEDLKNNNLLFAIYSFFKWENLELKEYFLASNNLTFKTN
jgi:hypothetical protein